jgi:hypothetical protein
MGKKRIEPEIKYIARANTRSVTEIRIRIDALRVAKSFAEEGSANGVAQRIQDTINSLTWQLSKGE